MEYIGGIDGMKFTPISNYNNYLKENASFEVDTNNSEFENILNKQTAQLQNGMQIQGGVSMNNNFDEVASQNAVHNIDGSSPSGNFLKSFSNSLNGGISSVNKAIDTANKAQEAFAAGEDVSVHDVMIASEKASLSLSMAMQLRNKLLSAYSEINNVKV